MDLLIKILDLKRNKYGNPKLDRLYWLSGIFFALGGLFPLIEGFSVIGSEHSFFGLVHIVFGFFLISLGQVRRFVPVRPLIHVGFLCVAFEFYYYNIYYGLGSGNYIFYIPFLVAVAFFFYGNFMIDFYLLVSLGIVSFFCSVYGPFFVETVLLSKDELQSIFVFNVISGVTMSFAFAIFYIKQLNESTKEIQNKIKEKEILLSEVNHRVRNNLNVISSLLKLQKDTLKNEEARDAISQSALRVHSMAWVHNHLYKGTEAGEISFKEYIEQLVQEIRYSAGIEKEIQLQLEVDSVSLDISKAIPLGQIINELITNSIKHAFDNIPNPEISVKIIQLKTGIELIYKDNGKGYDRNKVSIDSLGVFLINSLCEQIDGQGVFETEGRFEYHLRIQDVLIQ